jgi:hypothetical protein
MDSQAELLHVVGTTQTPGRLSGRLHSRQQQSDQRADDRDDDEHLHQRKRAAAPLGISVRTPNTDRMMKKAAA